MNWLKSIGVNICPCKECEKNKQIPQIPKASEPRIREKSISYKKIDGGNK